MLAKKYAIAALVIAFLVLIGFTIKNPENMELSAAFPKAHSNRWVAAAPIQLSGQDTTKDKDKIQLSKWRNLQRNLRLK